MMTFSEFERYLEPYDGSHLDLVTPTPEQLKGYNLSDLDRDNGSLYVAYHHLDNKGPQETLAELCAGQDTVAVLDAGCGTGNQLVKLVVQTALPREIEPARILGDAVSDHDFSRFSQNRLTRVALSAGLVNYEVLDLTDEQLPPNSYDLAYSYEVHMHNAQPEKIVDNVYQSLKPGGVMYFNTDGRQLEQMNDHVEQYRSAGVEVLSGEIIPTYGWVPPDQKNETRHAFKVTRPLQ